MHGGDDGGDSPARPAKRQRPSAPVLDVPAKLKDPKKKKYRDGRLLLDARRLSFRHAEANRRFPHRRRFARALGAVEPEEEAPSGRTFACRPLLT